MIKRFYLCYMFLVIALMAFAMAAGPERPGFALAFIFSLVPEFVYWLIKGKILCDVILDDDLEDES